MDFDDAADDEVADFGRVACAEGADGEEFVGFLQGACYGGGDCCGGRVGVGAVASGLFSVFFSEGWRREGLGGCGFTASIVGRRLRSRRE